MRQGSDVLERLALVLEVELGLTHRFHLKYGQVRGQVGAAEVQAKGDESADLVEDPLGHSALIGQDRDVGEHQGQDLRYFFWRYG